jgi:hypothetical protein
MTDQSQNSNTNSGTTNVNVTTGALAELVGETKKFKTTEDLAKGKLESDAFILKVTDENKELRAHLAAMDDRQKELERRVEFASRTSTTSGDTSNANGNPAGTQTQANGNQSTKSLSTEDVLRIVEENKTQERLNENLRNVDARLTKEFGADAKDLILRKAAELGLPKEYLIQVAQTSPNAFFNMIGLVESSSRNVGMSSTAAGVRSIPASSNNGVRNSAFYEKLKKEMGTMKFIQDRGTQVQMHKDMQELGDNW